MKNDISCPKFKINNEDCLGNICNADYAFIDKTGTMISSK